MNFSQLFADQLEFQELFQDSFLTCIHLVRDNPREVTPSVFPVFWPVVSASAGPLLSSQTYAWLLIPALYASPHERLDQSKTQKDKNIM